MPKVAKRRRRDYEKAANIIRDAGGRIVGRTRLQKIGFLLELAGLGEGFVFRYKYFGPYSEELNLASQLGDLLGTLNEEEKVAKWGGSYSIFTTNRPDDDISSHARKELAKTAASADPIELELAATAAYLHAAEGCHDAWQETARRKPDKATIQRVQKAKELYSKLWRIEAPRRLPTI